MDTPGPALNCLQGQAATADLVKRWRRYLELPPLAHTKIWEVLNPILLGLPRESVPQHVAQLSQVLGVEVGDLSLALEGCHALLLEATARNLDAAAFDEDLRRLSGDQGGHAARAALVEGFDSAKGLVRQRLVADSVADHGKVLTGLNWRIDRILSSSHGFQLNTPILLLTLHYEDAGEKQHTTLQVSDGVLTMLRDFCDKMLSVGSEAPSEEELQLETSRASADGAPAQPEPVAGAWS